MKKEEYKLGQNVILEGDRQRYVYFIEEGEFEMQKTIYLQKRGDSIYGQYLRLSSQDKIYNLQRVLNKNEITYSKERNELANFKADTKTLTKKIFRFSILGRGE